MDIKEELFKLINKRIQELEDKVNVFKKSDSYDNIEKLSKQVADIECLNMLNALKFDLQLATIKLEEINNQSFNGTKFPKIEVCFDYNNENKWMLINSINYDKEVFTVVGSDGNLKEHNLNNYQFRVAVDKSYKEEIKQQLLNKTLELASYSANKCYQDSLKDEN